MGDLSHFDAAGNAAMVDVSEKAVTARIAIAKGKVVMASATLQRITEGRIGKGDVLGVARLAGIMGAKRTSELIPLCHPLGLDQVQVELEPRPEESAVAITATAKVTARTGVEMEALTAVTVAALTIYDMCKAVDREMRLTDIHLVHKSGGKSGTFDAPG